MTDGAFKLLTELKQVTYSAKNWPIEQADRYYNLILDEIMYIAKNFEMARDFGHIRKGYRFSNVKSHLMFFRKTLTGEIEVIRILHQRMNVKSG